MATLTSSDIVGTWRLESWKCTWADGAVTFPYGGNPKGYYIFTQDGYSSATLMSGEPAEPSSMDPARAAFGPCLAYSGRYEIDIDKIVIHCEISSFPQWIGSDQVRYFKFTNAGDTLTLSTASKVQGKELTVALVWQRVRT